MVHLRHIAVFLIVACLGGCGGYAMLDPYTTASFTSSGTDSAPHASPTASDTQMASSGAASDQTDPAARASLFARAVAVQRSDAPAATSANAVVAKPAATPIALADADDNALPLAVSPRASPKSVQPPRGRAYLFRGVAGLIYSRGIDALAARIDRVGIPTTVGTYLLWRPTADQAIRDYRRDPQPITLIGHSMGGDCAVDFAEYLNAAHIPVSLLVTYDPTRIADDVPPNVERYINIYQSSNFMGGGNVVQGTRFHGHYASYNLKDHSEIIHINIEKNDRIQEQLVAKIAQLPDTPADAEGEAVPIHLEVPAHATVELWDSGLPVEAHAGNTLRSVAATYQVPAWALAQINSLSDREALTEGQRIVVPRHLVPRASDAVLTSFAPMAR